MIFVRNVKEYCLSGHPRLIWLLLIGVSLMGMIDIPMANIFATIIPSWLKWTLIVFCCAFKSSLLILVLAICYKYKFLKIFSYFLIGIYALLCMINFISFEFYGFGLSHKMVELVSGTNIVEISDFFSIFGSNLRDAFSLIMVIALLSAGVIYCLLTILSEKTFLLFAGVATSIGAISMIFLINDAYYGKNNFSVLARTTKNVVEAYRENAELKELMKKMKPYADTDKVVSNRKAFNLVLVIGESADKTHMSLYGYPLPTTPKMQAIADSLYIFTDAIASSKTTSDNIERILTSKRDTQSDNWWYHSSLIDIMNAAGYQTCWLSNQEKTGIWSNGTSVLASQANIVKYIGKSSSEDHMLQKYDESILPYLKKIVADTLRPKWIGVHLMGSHFAYSNRYPENHRYIFAENIRKIVPRKWMNNHKYEIAANYDNSIHYTDSVVREMVAIVAVQKKPSILIYLSDHGENVYDDRDYCGRDINHVKVPLIIYANSAYRKENPALTDALKNAITRKVSTANLPEVIMTLSGTTCPEYDASYDVLSPEYKQRVRYVEDIPYALDM